MKPFEGKQIDTGDAILSLLDEHVVLVETKPGVTLDKQKTDKFYEIVEKQMSGNYSLVINRKNDYRLMRFEVYNIANAHNRLRGIAIVTHKKVAGMMAELESPLSQKQFARFSNVDDAIAWARKLHQ